MSWCCQRQRLSQPPPSTHEHHGTPCQDGCLLFNPKCWPLSSGLGETSVPQQGQLSLPLLPCRNQGWPSADPDALPLDRAPLEHSARALSAPGGVRMPWGRRAPQQGTSLLFWNSHLANVGHSPTPCFQGLWKDMGHMALKAKEK